MDDKQRKQTVACSCNCVTCRSRKTTSVLLWSTNKILISGLGYLWTLRWSCSGGFPVDPCYRKLHHGRGDKSYFTVWISNFFEVHWLKLNTKLFLDGISDLSLTLWREFRETQGFCVLQHLGWYWLAEEGGGQGGGHWVKHSCGKHQEAPCGARWMWLHVSCRNKLPAPLWGRQHLRQGCRELLGEKPCDSMNEALLDFLDSGLPVLKDELQNSWRKAESFWNL